MVMRIKMRMARWDKRQTDTLFYLSLFVLAILVFLFVGSREPVLFDDSSSYTKIERIEGVMPIYPLFLLMNQWIFGNDRYLQIVIVEQALLAAVCILLFVREIRKEFSLQYWEGYLLFFFSLLSYTTEMPQAMMTQAILTEGLAFSLYYLLVILFLRAVWRKSYIILAGSFAMAFLLAMLRSQLQILFGVCGVLFLYLTWSKCGRGVKKWVGVSVGLAGCVLIGVIGISLTAASLNRYHSLIIDDRKVNAFIMRVQEPKYYKKLLVGEAGGQDAKEENAHRDQKEVEQAIQERIETLFSKKRPLVTSQYTTLIFSRGMYEADEEDVQLFQDEMTRGLYQALYAAADGENQRYIYAQKGLWMWKDIVGGIGSVGKTALFTGIDYYQENWPEVYEDNDFNAIWNRSLQTIGMGLLKEHFGRFLYHTLMMLPQAFICTVFFQIKPIYLLCHLVTLFLYLSAFALMIWGYANRKASNQCAEFMALILGSNLVMIFIISLVFFGQQRYLVYNFGIFYMAYYVLLRELWNCRLRDLVMRRWFGKNE